MPERAEDTILAKTTGLNTLHDPVDLDRSELQYAVDVMIRDSGRISRADGHAKIISLTDGHSLFCDGGECLVADGTGLHKIGSDYSLSTVATGFTGNFFDFKQYADSIYFVNGHDKGLVNEGIPHLWPVDVYNGPPTSKYFETVIPRFTHIAFNHGYCYGAIKNTLVCSQLGQPGLFCLEKAILFRSEIIGIKAIPSGLIVSDLHATYHLRGTCVDDFTETKIADYPMFKWSFAIDHIAGDEIGLSGECALWGSPKGICMCTPDGGFQNITEKKIVYPKNGQYAATLLRGHNLISSIDSSFTTDTNLVVSGTTQRKQFTFNSYCKFGSDYLACAADGVYLLGGDTINDEDIDAVFETRTSNMGYEGRKRCYFGYLDMEATGKLQVTPYIGDDNHPCLTVYNSKSGQHQARFKMGRGAIGDWWKFRINNVAGSDFSIDSFRVLHAPHSRARGN